MSDVLFDNGAVHLSTHAGPSAEGRDRRRWQITLPGGGPQNFAVLRRMDAEALCAVLRRSLTDPLDPANA